MAFLGVTGVSISIVVVGSQEYKQNIAYFKYRQLDHIPKYLFNQCSRKVYKINFNFANFYIKQPFKMESIFIEVSNSFSLNVNTKNW